MSIYLPLLVLQLAVQLFVPFRKPRSFAQGKILTKPVRLGIGRLAIKRQIFWLFRFALNAMVFRLVQLQAVILVGVTLGAVVTSYLYSVSPVLVIALYVDDYFSDNDWKEKWDKAKNKVAWLWTPAMEPVKQW